MPVPLVVAYGLGVDSTAVLVELHRQQLRPDLILFADTKSEKAETYQYLPIIQEWLTRVGFPPVVVVENVVKDYKHWPPYQGLLQNCLTNGTLPSLAFGFKSCSLKHKVAPQNKYCDQWQPAIDCWAAGQKVRKIIGYDDSPKDQKRYAQAIGVEDPKYDYWYPLIDWHWGRERCKEEIRKAGLPVPPKSACIMCPATQPEELHEFRKVYLRTIVILEARAKPRLEGHIPQETLDAEYEIKLAVWDLKHGAAAEAGKKVPKMPRRGKNATGILGLWRRGVKGTRGGKARPGMMTDYIRQHGLLPAAEIDHLIASAPTAILDRQEAFENGMEIPAWHDFIEMFTPEDAVDEITAGLHKLPVLHNGCEGCSAC